jgi:hypothetical protein
VSIRIRIVQWPLPASIDGIRLDHFEPGQIYEVGNSIGSLLLAERWAEPAPAADPAPDIPSTRNVRKTAEREGDARPKPESPPSLIRESHPPSLESDPFELAADTNRPPKRPR